MDRLLASNNRPRILVSSTNITDLSRKISVGADDMLVNAINHMNTKSGAYVFLDQSFEKEVGQLELLTPTEDRKKPRFYFRGAITQVDTNTLNDKFDVSLDLADAPHPLTIKGGKLSKASPSISKGVSIVSVDLHLVSYPDKTVLPGGSVANSMVVTNKTFGTGGTGLIKLTGYNMTLSFNRVESIGQAVRNLIELGVIELLGKHARVPYWTCLNIEPANEKLQNAKRSLYQTTPTPVSVFDVQHMLTKLGYYKHQKSGVMTRETHAAIAKYQSEKGLIATGDMNFDLYARLKQDFHGYPANGRIKGTLTSANKPNGKHLSIAAPRKINRIGGKFHMEIQSNAAGYLNCFHQSGQSQVTQILPTIPGKKLHISRKFTRNLPKMGDGFELHFDKKGQSERVMCTLREIGKNSTFEFDSSLKMFGPLNIFRLEDIPKATHGLKDWVMISRKAF